MSETIERMPARLTVNGEVRTIVVEPARAKRTAVVALRYGEVELCRPRDEQDRSLPESLRLRLIEVREILRRRKGVGPLHWRLLTTHQIADADQAWQIVGWYQAR
jgi:hypothetical protein